MILSIVTWYSLHLTCLFQKRQIPIYRSKTDLGVILLNHLIYRLCRRMCLCRKQVIINRFSLPAIVQSSFAALEGADGKSVIVLVKFSNEDDLLPVEEADAMFRAVVT